MKRSFFNRFPEYSYSEEEWVEKFLNRINEMIFSAIEKWHNYDTFFLNICSLLWYKSSNYETWSYWLWNEYLWLESLTNRDLWKTLDLLENIPEKYFDSIDLIIKISKNKDNIDLWIRFYKGLFYKAWDEDLDKIIIDNSIDNISTYDKAKKHYKEALINYSSWRYSEALTSCYTTIEKLAQEILWNSKTLWNNQDELVKFLKNWNDDEFVKQWREIIKHLCTYLHDFSTRHWWKIDDIDEIEVDATIYLTWTIINLLSKKNVLNKKIKNNEQTES